jgi:FG-GAP repeat
VTRPDDVYQHVGFAYVFVRNNGVWTQQAMLAASDSVVHNSFGWSGALDGDTAVITAPGTNNAYVFDRVGGAWSQVAELTAPDGASLWQAAISGSTIALGAQKENNQTGAVYVFSNSGGTWSFESELAAADGTFGGLFGTSVAMSSDGSTIVVGGTDVYGDDLGAAYVFTLSTGAWSQSAELHASDGFTDDQFGTSVAIDGGRIIVDANRTGAAYIFA